MVRDTHINNRIILQGKIKKPIMYSHQIHDEIFYSMEISCRRMSGTFDIIPVTISKKTMGNILVDDELHYLIKGQIRSYNRVVSGKNKLVITVFAKSIEISDEEKEGLNSVYLEGYICKEPSYRKTPFLREISDILLAINRPHRKSDYIPVIAWGYTARKASKLKVSDEVLVTGRLQSRNYTKKFKDGTSIERIAYEVSAMRLEKKPIVDSFSYD